MKEQDNYWKILPVLLTSLGLFAVTQLLFLNKVLAPKFFYEKSFIPDMGYDDTLNFVLVGIPSIIGFISSIVTPFWPKITGILMVVCGGFLVVPEFIGEYTMINFFAGMLYVIGGVVAILKLK